MEGLKEEEKKRSAEVNNFLRDGLPKILEKREKIKGVNYIFSLEDNLEMNALRCLADMIKEKTDHAVIALGSQEKEQKRAFLVIAVTQDLLSSGMDAGKLIRQISPIIGGSRRRKAGLRAGRRE